jgi:hypothetical protein
MIFAHSLVPRPEERFLNRVSKDEASWFETRSFAPLLTMRFVLKPEMIRW